MRYLITGGAGFIGSHLSDSLIGRGDCVTALDDVSTGAITNVTHLLSNKDFDFVEGTILDATLVEKLVQDHDVVVHLAAAVGVRLIVERPLESLLRTSVVPRTSSRRPRCTNAEFSSHPPQRSTARTPAVP